MQAITNTSCAHPPPGTCGAFAHIVSPGGRALANPRATPGLLTPRGLTRDPYVDDFVGKDSSLSPIGLSVKDWTKLLRFLKACLLDFMHFLLVYQATT